MATSSKTFTRYLPHVAVVAVLILIFHLQFGRMYGAGVMDDSIGTLLDPTDAELEKCYIPTYMANVKNATVAMARDHWFRGGYLKNNPHCPRNPEPGELPPTMTDEEAVRYMQTYPSLNKTTLKDDIVKAKEHWETTGWKEGRIIPEKPVSFLGKVIALVGGNNKTKYCGVDMKNKLKQIDCKRTTIDKEAVFETEKISDTEFALKNQATQQYCSDAGAVGMMCNKDNVGPYETFAYKHMGNKQFLFTGRPSARLRCGFNGKVVVCDNKNNGRTGVFQWIEHVAAAPATATASTTTSTETTLDTSTASQTQPTDAETTETDDALSAQSMVVTLTGPRNKLQCGADPTTKLVSCDRTTVTDYERFEIAKNKQNGKRYTLKNQGTQKYCKDLGDNIECNVDEIQPNQFANFQILRTGKKEIRIVGPKSGKDRLVCADRGDRIQCSQKKAGLLTRFLWNRADAQTASKEAAADATFYATAKAAADKAAANVQANAQKIAEDAQVVADRASANAINASEKAIAYAQAIAEKAAADKLLLDAKNPTAVEFAADVKTTADKVVAETKAALEKATLDAEAAAEQATAYANAAAEEAIAVAKAIAEAKAIADAKAEADAKAAALKDAAEAEAAAQAKAAAEAEAAAQVKAAEEANAAAQANATAQANAAADAHAANTNISSNSSIKPSSDTVPKPASTTTDPEIISDDTDDMIYMEDTAPTSESNPVVWIVGGVAVLGGAYLIAKRPWKK